MCDGINEFRKKNLLIMVKQFRADRIINNPDNDSGRFMHVGMAQGALPAVPWGKSGGGVCCLAMPGKGEEDPAAGTSRGGRQQ